MRLRGSDYNLGSMLRTRSPTADENDAHPRPEPIAMVSKLTP